MSKMKNFFENCVELYMENHPNISEDVARKYVENKPEGVQYWINYERNRCYQAFFSQERHSYTDILVNREDIKEASKIVGDMIMFDKRFSKDYMDSNIVINTFGPITVSPPINVIRIIIFWEAECVDKIEKPALFLKKISKKALKSHKIPVL